MLNAYSNNRAYASTLTSARIVVSIDWWYETLIYKLNWLYLSILYSLLFRLTTILLIRRRKRVVKYMKVLDSKDCLNFSNYKNLKFYLKSFDELLPRMRKVQSYNLREVPSSVTNFMKELKRTNQTILQYRDWLIKKLDDYNKEQYSSTQLKFKHVPERELSSRRSNVYEYWL